MLNATKRSGSLFLLFTLMLISSRKAFPANGVTLYTPYTKISVPPGASIDYTIDIINNSSIVRNVGISMTGMPKGWSYDIKSGGWDIKQVSVLPDKKESISLRVEVPLKVNKGRYRFTVAAGGFYSLPLTVIVSEQGTYKTEFTTKQSNMEGHAGSSFTFTADLQNRTADKQLYALRANAPRGWDVDFKANYKQVTSVNIEANGTENITIDINPPDEIDAGTYKIPVRAATSNTSADLTLEVVITGSYNMELTTPRGLLSAGITAGNEQKVELVVKNTGSATLNDINLSSETPVNWQVNFDPQKINKLEPGKSYKVLATVKADKKAIPGDYVMNLEARTPEANSKAVFRMSVKTPLLWGWVGILIILATLGSVYYLFRKYGRR